MTEFISQLISALLQLMLFLIIPVVWWIITDRKTNFFQWIGIKKTVFNGCIFKPLSIILVVLSLYVIAMYFIMGSLLGETQTATSQFAGKGIRVLPSVLVYAIVQTSLSEELFFRGFLCNRLTNRFGFFTGNLLQSISFGLLHGIPFGLATGNWFVCILLTLLPASMGYVQGWLNEKAANGSIIPSWILHGLMNFLSVISSL